MLGDLLDRLVLGQQLLALTDVADDLLRGVMASFHLGVPPCANHGASGSHPRWTRPARGHVTLATSESESNLG